MSYLRLLFWLKWTLLLRGFRRDRAALVGVLLAVLLFLPMALGGAALGLFAFWRLGPAGDEQLARGVLLGIYLIWILGPLLGYALSDSYDLTKLLLFPLSARQIFTGVLLGSLLDFPVLLLMPLLLVVAVAFSSSPFAAVVAFLAVALFLFHTLALSQALILASAGVLRSRRFRDLLMVLFPLLWIGYYLLMHSVPWREVARHWDRYRAAWEAVGALPPGLAARAAAAAARGELLPAFGYLLALFLCAAATLYLAAWLIERVYDGLAVGPAPRRRRAPAAAPTDERPASSERRPKAPGGLAPARAPGASSFFGIRLPPVVEAMVDKEVKYLFRDPYFKTLLMNMVYMLVVAAVAFRGARAGAGASHFRSLAAWGASAMVFMAELPLLCNLYGTEGSAAATLFMFPSSRRQLIVGKNLALFAAFSVVNLVVVLLLALFTGAVAQVGPLYCWMELALLVFLAVGNLLSIWFPSRIVMRGWRMQQQQASKGCLYGLLYLAASLVAFALLLPVAAALVIPTFWASATWYLLTVPAATAYAAGLYALSLRLAVPLLLEREVPIVARLTGEE